MNVEIPGAELEALHRKQNGDVLAITVHVQLNPLRLGFLGADGELKTFAVGQVVTNSPAIYTGAIGAGPEAPSPQCVSVQGMDVNLFGQFGGSR